MFRFRSLSLSALTALLATGMLVAGCSSGTKNATSPAQKNGREGMKIIMITHGQAADPYWSVVKHGADDAAHDLGVSFSYQAPQTFDIPQMQTMFKAAIAQKPTGIAVSITDEAAIGPLIKDAVAAGIPVVSLDSGEGVAYKYGVLTHVGADQHELAKLAGERFASGGAHKVLCLNHEQGNASLDIRCRGLKDGVAKSGGTTIDLAISANDPTDSAQRIQAALSKDPSIDAILALGPVGATPMLQAAGKSGFKGKVASFDLAPDMLEAIIAGKMDFAIDSQQYLMGYLPVLYLTQYAQYGLVPTLAITPTGPAFITKDNASKVLELTKKGVR